MKKILAVGAVSVLGLSAFIGPAHASSPPDPCAGAIQEILVDSPASYYTLGDSAGTTAAADCSGNQAPSLTMTGTGTDVVLGTGTGTGTDGLTAATFAGGKYLVSPVETLGDVVALECFFSTSTTPGADPMTIMAGGTPGNVIGIHSDGKIHTNFYGDLTSPVVTDGLTHHLVWETGHVYLDGADIGSPFFDLAATTGNISVGGGGTSGGTRVPFVGTIAHFAAYTSSLSAARAAAHSAAGLTARLVGCQAAMLDARIRLLRQQTVIRSQSALLQQRRERIVRLKAAVSRRDATIRRKNAEIRRLRAALAAH